MLKVPVQGHDDLSPGMVETGHQCGSLAIVSSQLNHHHPRVFFVEDLENIEGFVRAAVVDQDHLPGVFLRL